MKVSEVRTFDEELASIKKVEAAFWKNYKDSPNDDPSGMETANINGSNGHIWSENKILSQIIKSSRSVSKRQGFVETIDADDATYCIRAYIPGAKGELLFDFGIFHECRYDLKESPSSHSKRVDCIIVNNITGKQIHVEVKTQLALTNGYERVYKLATAGGQATLRRNFPNLKGSHFIFIGSGFEDGSVNRCEIQETLGGSKIGYSFCANAAEEASLSSEIEKMLEIIW